MLLAQIGINLIVGTKSTPSIVKIVKCSILDWLLQFIYIASCFAVTIFAVKIVNNEQRLKIKYGHGLVKSDIKFVRSVVIRLVLFSFAGGWVSGALGLGGGAIFNPLLLSMGVAPSVAGSTGMYMIMFSTTGSTVAYILLGYLNIYYGLWIGIWCALGSVCGMILLNKIMKKLNR